LQVVAALELLGASRIAQELDRQQQQQLIQEGSDAEFVSSENQSSGEPDLQAKKLQQNPMKD
jgi:hypothetical protein